MIGNFEACLAHVLKYEGGWSDHPADPGGATMKGITQHTYSQWLGRPASKTELKAIPDRHVAAIYRREYWDKVRGDELPAGLDLVAFDAAVNSGPSRGTKWLQRALGVGEDGVLGPASMSAARLAEIDVIEDACDARLAFLRSLRTWPTFGKGWAARVAATEALACEMFRGRNPVPPPNQNPIKTEPTTAPETGLFAAILAALKGFLK